MTDDTHPLPRSDGDGLSEPRTRSSDEGGFRVETLVTYLICHILDYSTRRIRVPSECYKQFVGRYS